MTETDHTTPTTADTGTSADPSWEAPSVGRRIWHAILAMIVVACAIGVAYWMLHTVPRSGRRKPRQYATLVQYQQFQYSREAIVIEAMGTVRAAREITLFPRVRGEIVGVNRALLPGGLFRKGRTMLRIDPKDYRWLVKGRESALAQAQAALALEQGRQQIARREYAMVNKRKANKGDALMLRKPQLLTAQANIQAAKAELAMARLNLQRSLIRAPFDCVILERMIHGGSRVTETTPLVRLAGTKRFWVEVALGVDQLRWLDIPQTGRGKGSEVHIFSPDAWGADKHRTGHILRLFPAVETQGRMARLLIEIQDPLGLKTPKAKLPRLLLGAYVQAHLKGRQPTGNVLRLPRRYLRDLDTVWLLSSKQTLDIRKVTILHRSKEDVLIERGLRPGDKVITTLLPTPIQGMPLRTTSSKKRRSRP